MRKNKRRKITFAVMSFLSILLLLFAAIGIYTYQNVDFRGDEALFLASKTRGLTKIY